MNSFRGERQFILTRRQIDNILKQIHVVAALPPPQAPWTIEPALTLARRTEQALADVKADIVNELRMQEAAKKSKALGEARLEALRGNAPPDVTWSEARTVSRAQAIGPGAEAVRAIFRAGATKLPAYVGVEQPGQGYVIYRIESVMLPGDAEVDKRLDTMRDQLVRVTGAQDFSGYLASLRARANVEIKDKALDPARAASPEPAR